MTGLAGTGRRPVADLAVHIEAALAFAYDAEGPGATVIAVHGDEVLYRGARGLANVEHGIRLRPDMPLRLGSISKPFTALAILMLMEEGRLALQDPLVRHWPDFPHADITIEQLLAHSDGLQNHTTLPEWQALNRQPTSTTELVALFSALPLRFSPGERHVYGNSGYVVLGALIERLSGLSYADFVERRIFAPLGMDASAYDRTQRLMAGRVSGYELDGEACVNAAYLDMSHPHAAGGLLSSVEDLARWNSVLDTDRLLSAATRQRAFSRYRLNDGTLAPYGLGWGIDDYEGEPMREHGGVINGFRSYMVSLPARGSFVAVLSNRSWGPSPAWLCRYVLALLRGEVLPLPVAIDADLLLRLSGDYRLDDGSCRRVTAQAGTLVSRRGDGGLRRLLPVSRLEFYDEEYPHNRFVFVETNTGAIAAMERWLCSQRQDIARRL